MRQGFTLIQISILLVIASLVMVAILPSTRTNLNAGNVTTTKMNTLVTALRSYISANGKLPCPADASQPIGSTNYGVAAANAGADSNCTGGTPTANFVDATNSTAIGMVPVRTLGLSNDYALDGWGRTIMYGVDTNATSCWLDTAITGRILVTDNGAVNNSVLALVSHGPDGHGAWIPLPGSSGTASRLNAGSTDVDQLLNAHITTGTFPTASASSQGATSEGTTSTFVKKAPTSTFDDIVYYNSPLWNFSALPSSYAMLSPTITSYPNNGIYILNNALNFTATYSSPVTVTGTPRLVLTIGSNTRYANYVSGSGTTALTFKYTVVPADYTTSGISMASSIDLNGGNIMNGLYCTATGLIPPSLSGVLISAPSLIAISASTDTHCTGSVPCIEIMDTNNSRIEKWTNTAAPGSSTPAYVSTTGVAGTATSPVSFNNPSGVSSGPSNGYLVVIADTGNNRLMRLTNALAYNTKLGTAGTATGQFNSPMGIVYDTTVTCSGPCMWVTDTGNNRLQKISNISFASVGVYGTSTYNSLALSYPTGVAVDSSNNAYVVDTGNNRIVEFNSSGTYLNTFGSYGAANNAGSFSNPTGIAIDTTTNCTGGTACMWIADSGNNQIQRCSVDMVGGSHCTIFGSYGTGNAPNFSQPTGIAVDHNNYVYVVDDNNSRVVVLSSAGAYVTSFGSAGTGSGQFAF